MQHLFLQLGTVHFFIRCGGGGGGRGGFGGGQAKKQGRGGGGGGGGQAKKNIGCKAVVTKRILSSFAVTVSVVTKWATASKTSPNSRCFKLHHSYGNSFKLSNVCIFFHDLNSK